MTPAEWRVAFEVAAAHADQPIDARTMMVIARKLIDRPDHQLAERLVQEMVEATQRDRRADPLLAVAALLTIEGGAVAVVRLFEAALTRLAQSPKPQAS